MGTILSTLTGDVQTIQASRRHRPLRWDFALIALAVTPLLAAFVLCVNKAVRTAVTEVRTRQSDPLATLREGLQSIEVVKAFTREDRQEQRVKK